MTGPSVTSRALAVLGAFDEEHPRLLLTDLARRAGLPLTTAHRLVGELTAWGALERSADGSFGIGRRLWQVGTLATVQSGLREAALPPMQDLYEATHENVQVAVLSDGQALYVERIHGPGSVALVSRPGGRLPLHATGVGKVLLAHLPDDEIAAMLADLRPVTRYTITERGRMAREISAIRRQGYATTAEEMTLGTCSVAVPVVDASGTVTAALGLVTASSRRGLLRFVPALQVAAAAITRAMAGGPGFR